MNVRDEVDRYCVPALERGIRILALVGGQRAGISSADIVRELGLPRATTFRLLRTLESLGCLRRAEGGGYRVGPAVLRLGFEFLGSLEVTRVARDAVERLRDRTGCSAQLVIRDGREIVVVLRAVGPGAFSTNVSVGTRLPAHATVLGRMLLCELTDVELGDLYPELDLPRVGAAAPGTRAELKKLLYGDLVRGYAVSESLFEQGISAVAAPVRAPDGEFVAAVSLTVYRPTLEPAALRERLVQEVIAAAAEISESLSCGTPDPVGLGEDPRRRDSAGGAVRLHPREGRRSPGGTLPTRARSRVPRL
jgi:DNA-binding IclR family transcriptional regulator